MRTEQRRDRWMWLVVIGAVLYFVLRAAASLLFNV